MSPTTDAAASRATPSRPALDRITVDADGPALLFSGVLAGSTAPVVTLAGTRQELPGSVTVDGDRWSATVPLLHSQWGGPALPPRSGRYLFSGVSVAAPLPAAQLIVGVTRASFSPSDDGLVVDFAAPLTDRERGGAQQAALEADYRATDFAPLDAVFFESFYGRNASCNPLAIDRVIARERPDILRYWSVADASVQVPEGGIPIIDGSAEWWRVRGSARLLVVNDWLRKRYKKRPHQTVLQTWHGTMLKKLALSRSNVSLRTRLATLRESRRWDILLAQNEYSRGVFRRAYGYLKQVWEEGYPRDDVLSADPTRGGDSAPVRARLGIPSGARVVLYAPTWRDDDPDHVDHLDVARFTAELGDGYVTLIRGHSRTLLPGEDVHAPGVIDVTGYPDISELFLVADVLVTDYSSVMFDFTVTGKPVFFFTPDLDHYRERLRGFYFDLLPVAPGPIVQGLHELVRLVKDSDAVASDFADRYAAWRERFNPRDDGRAAERVVTRLLAEGYVG